MAVGDTKDLTDDGTMRAFLLSKNRLRKFRRHIARNKLEEMIIIQMKQLRYA